MLIYRTDKDSISDKPLTKHSVILDLDETLVHSSENIKVLKELKIFTDPKLIDVRKRTYLTFLDNEEDKNEISMYWGIERPHLRKFLIFCFSYFQVVAIWSAGQYQYVHSIVNSIFRGLKRPMTIYTRDDCEEQGEVYLKPISKMIELEPTLNKIMKLEHTFIIDDRWASFGYVNPYNGILIPRYTPHLTINDLRADDSTFPQLINWFTRYEVRNASDIRLLDKSNIFESQPLSYDDLRPGTPRLSRKSSIVRDRNSPLEEVDYR